MGKLPAHGSRASVRGLQSDRRCRRGTYLARFATSSRTTRCTEPLVGVRRYEKAPGPFVARRLYARLDFEPILWIARAKSAAGSRARCAHRGCDGEFVERTGNDL